MISLFISTADQSGSFVFAYAKDRFFPDYAQLMLVLVYFQIEQCQDWAKFHNYKRVKRSKCKTDKLEEKQKKILNLTENERNTCSFTSQKSLRMG